MSGQERGLWSRLPCEQILALRYVTIRSYLNPILVFSSVKMEVIVKLIHTVVVKIKQANMYTVL